MMKWQNKAVNNIISALKQEFYVWEKNEKNSCQTVIVFVNMNPAFKGPTKQTQICFHVSLLFFQSKFCLILLLWDSFCTSLTLGALEPVT